MSAKDVQVWLGIGAILLTAGIWLGTLSARITQLETLQKFEHGEFTLPKGLGQ